MRRSPLVAILGCGPSGLLAAHACTQYGVPFVIFSRKVMSDLGGAQFSHIAIPGLSDAEFPEVELAYRVNGDAETYQRKVYGDAEVPFVSFENVKDGMTVPAWNLRGIYRALAERFGDQVTDTMLDPSVAEEFNKTGLFKFVFSSVPAPYLCRTGMDPSVGHWFRSHTIRLHNEALNPSLPDNTIEYDGTWDHSYYRMSRIFGVGSTEWGAPSPTPPIGDLRVVSKPIATNCDCHPNLTRIGRFGTWTKGVLTMHAYQAVVEKLEEVLA